MRNWIGQDIQPGDTVYRGARDRNLSSFRLGTVVSLNEAQESVRVHWKFSEYRHRPYRENYTSTVPVESVVQVVVDLDALET
jgi:hypothetical protein